MDEEKLFNGKYVNKDTGTIKEYVDDNVDILNERITNEVNTLNTRIDTEVETLNNRIDKEVDDLNDRVDKDVNTLNTRIEKEVDTINTRIDTEVETLNNRIDKEVDDLNDTINTEVTRLDEKIDNTNTTINNRITDEVDTLNTRITNEISNINSNINQEVERLDERIDQTNSTMENHVTTINNRITDEVDTLNTRIDNEVNDLNETINNLASNSGDEIERLDERINQTNTNLENNVNTINTRITNEVNDLTDYIDGLIDDIEDGTIVAEYANKLKTPRNINGTAFDGSKNITTANWGTARDITIGNTKKSVNGSGNVSWSIAEIGAVPASGGSMTGGLTINTNNGNAPLTINRNGTISEETDIYQSDNGLVMDITNDEAVSSITINMTATDTENSNGSNANSNTVKITSNKNGTTISATNFDGNASSATKLATVRKINGTSFDGSKDITTTNWGTARNITISDADGTNSGVPVSVNGSGNYILKLPSTIKATFTGNAATATKLAKARTVELSGIVSGSASFDGSANATISTSVTKPPKSGDWFSGGIPSVSTGGVMDIGRYIDLHHTDSSTNDYDVRLQTSGAHQNTVSLPTGTGTLALTTDNVASANKLYTARTITLSGDVSGSTSFDGSGNVSITTTVANDSHSHSNYLLLSGGTVTGDTTFEKYVKINAWPNYGSGTANLWYDGTNKTVEIETAIDLKLNGTKVSKAGHTHNYAGSSSAGGVANSAAKLANARTITLSGDVSGSTSFDGSGNVSISTTVANDSHGHNSINTKGTNTINSKANDTTANWGAQGNSVHWYTTAGLLNDQPGQWGYILNLGSGSEVHQIWATQASGNLAHRGGNASGWSGSWRTIIDSSNLSSYVPLFTRTSVGDGGWTVADNNAAVTVSGLAYWNGAYKDTSSNLAYCNQGAFGSIVTKNAGDYATASHGHTTPTSGAYWNGGYVKVNTDGVSEIGKYIDFHSSNGTTADFNARLSENNGNIEASGGLKATNNLYAGAKLSMGSGGSDVYIHNSTSGKYLQLKDDGTLAYSGTAVSLSGHTHNYAAASHTHSYLPLSGGTMTGEVYMERGGSSDNVYWSTKRTDTNVQVRFGVGSGGYNHGVYSDFFSKWLIYGDAKNNDVKMAMKYAADNSFGMYGFRYGGGLGGVAGYVTFTW